MFKKRNAVLAAAMLALSTGALADSFIFDPTGTAGSAGDITGLTSLNIAPGNTLAQGGGGTLTPGQIVTVLYQANYNNASGTALSPAQVAASTNGVQGNYFTFVAGYTEVVTSGGGNTAGFSLVSSAPSFFKIYETNAPASTVTGAVDLTGAGFTNGTVILSGTILNSGYASSYSQTLTPASTSQQELFDQSGSDNYAGKQAVDGGGGTTLTTIITGINSNFFPDLTVGTTLAFFTGTQTDPFKNVDPSQAFINSTGTASAVTAPNLCTVNGGASSATCTAANGFQLQTVGTATFTRAVPEPDSVLLLGLGLGLAGLISKRRKSRA